MGGERGATPTSIRGQGCDAALIKGAEGRGAGLHCSTVGLLIRLFHAPPHHHRPHRSAGQCPVNKIDLCSKVVVRWYSGIQYLYYIQ
jgi:hypothetical protein